MNHGRSLRRSALLVLSMLSACAAAQPGGGGDMPAAPLTIGSAAAAQLIARHAVAVGDMSEAAQAFDRLAKDAPNDSDLTRQAFLTNLLAGRPEALEFARQLPQFQAAQMLLADNDAGNGKWQQAEKRYSGLLRQGAVDVMRPLLMAWAAAGGGQYDQALARLQPLMDGPRFRAVYILNAAMIADLAGKDDQAAGLYRRAETEFGVPNLPMLRHEASFLARHGQRPAAEAKLRAIAGTSEEMALALPGLLRTLDQRQIHNARDGLAEVYTSFAAALRGQTNNDFATVLLRLALNLDPQLTSARLLAADIALAAKQPDGALRMLAPVAADDPLLPLVLVRRAVILNGMGQTDQAVALLGEVAKAVPTLPDPLAMQGDMLRGKGRYDAAVAAYGRAIALVGTPKAANWPLFYNRAIALDRAHHWQQAEADLQQALALSPDQPYVLNYLGYSWIEHGRNLQQARRMIERAAAQRPDDGAIADSLGWAVLRQGDVPGAVKQLERASELEPNDATITMHLGDAYWAAGRKLEAQFQWRRAMTLNPEPGDEAKLEAKIAEGEKVLGTPAAAAEPSGTVNTMR
ncbi:MAG: hypothetical protein BGP12_02335 [Rhodospirillales bacterium 70-18]|nr:MAG: hypothetical protein BGP12_02335 [Rhodospirillales bacterium 70-18]